MLRELSLQDLGIFARAQLSFEAGLTAITGETGSGKSLIVNALELCLGGRADPTLIRHGASKAVVSAAIDVERQKLETDEAGAIELEEGCLYVQREVAAEGRSQCRLNGKLAPLSQLKWISELLVDLHGQHENQTILHVGSHRSIYDAWLGSKAAAALQEVGEQFELWSRLKSQLSEMESDERQRAREIDLLQYQVQEIEAVQPKLNEYQQLTDEIVRLRNFEKLKGLTQSAYDTLFSEEDSAMQRVSIADKSLEEAASLDRNLSDSAQAVQQARLELESAMIALRNAMGSLDGDEDRLNVAEQRVSALQGLRRKYGSDEAAILEFYRESKQRLEMLINLEENKTALESAVNTAIEKLSLSASKLSHIRIENRAQFSKQIQAELSELAMHHARVEVHLAPKPVSADGCDEVEFLFSANKGEPLKPLAKIASGGELSRLTLAIKTILAGGAGPSTLVFDEVDAGLGGETAIALGRKLAKLAEFYQVIVITHLPHVAAFAQTHYRVQKSEVGGRTVAEIVQLCSQERVPELSRMLAGENAAEGAAVTAEALLAQAGNLETKASLR